VDGKETLVGSSAAAAEGAIRFSGRLALDRAHLPTRSNEISLRQLHVRTGRCRRSGARPINVDFANGFIGELSSELQS
jgi:hypothetical protein